MNYVKSSDHEVIQNFLKKKHKDNSLLLLWKNQNGKRVKLNQNVMFIEIKTDALVFFSEDMLPEITDREIYLTPLDFEISLKLLVKSFRPSKTGTFIETEYPKEIVYNEKRLNHRAKYVGNNLKVFIYHTDDKKNKLKAYLYDYSLEGAALHVPKKHFHIVRLMENIQITFETHKASIITVNGKIVYLQNSSPHLANSSLLGIKIKDPIDWSEIHEQA